jgi:hypothetical protein
MPEDLATLRKQTAEFIGYNPVIINLQRATTESDGAGGVRRTLGPVGDQTFRKITQNTSTAVFRRTIDGQEVQPEFVLLGMHSADIKNGDWFYQDGIKYEVVYVRDDRRYETWGEVAYRG